jgi:RepB DNA-primase from phage plasmid
MQKTVDLSYQGMRRQLNAMGCPSYELGIFNRTEETMKLLENVKPERILGREFYQYLRYENTDRMDENGKLIKGKDIYIRPAPVEGMNQGIILVDDLGFGTTERMKQDGLNAAAIIQTSPMDYQAWVRISDEPIHDVVATAAAKILAETYGGDRASADWRHFGRLAGFTNKKPLYNNPYVRAETCNGKQAERAGDILALALERAEQKRQEEAANLEKRQNHQPSKRRGAISPDLFYQKEYKRLLEWGERTGKSSSDLTPSQIDFMICQNMMWAGYSESEMISAILNNRPDWTNHETVREQYAERTVKNTILKTPAGATSKPKPKPRLQPKP